VTEIEDLDTEALKEKIKEYHSLINNTESCSVKRLQNYNKLLAELDDRGIEFEVIQTIQFKE
jgi:hypothetical protein